MKGIALRQVVSASKADAFEREPPRLCEKCFLPYGEAAGGKRIQFYLRRARRKLCETIKPPAFRLAVLMFGGNGLPRRFAPRNDSHSCCEDAGRAARVGGRGKPLPYKGETED